MHGGGYIGAAAHLSFAPRSGVGVVVLANAAPAGQAFCDIASIDVYDRLRGPPPRPDLLPRYLQRIESYRAVRRGVESGPRLTDAGLSLDAGQYAGVCANEHLGEITIVPDGDRLVARMNVLPPGLRAGGVDRLTIVDASGDTYAGEFTIGAVGAVEALRFQFEDEQWTVFERR